MTQTPKDARDETARAAVQITSEPRQILTRLLPLTPELYAHYADAPVQQQPEQPEDEEGGQ